MKRRHFLGGAAGSLVAGPSLAAGACNNFDPNGFRTCTVGLQNVPTIYQDCEQWCWAACAELAFVMQGIPVDQMDFVAKAYGGLVCEPATGPVIQDAINGLWQDQWGNRRQAWMTPIVDVQQGIFHSDPFEAARLELLNDRVVMVGTLGHAICMTAMTYVENSFGNRQLRDIKERDPWRTSGNFYSMTPAQFNNMSLIAAVQFS